MRSCSFAKAPPKPNNPRSERPQNFLKRSIARSHWGLHPMACSSGHAIMFGNNQRNIMPDKRTIERARADRQRGKSASTQAGEFVREEMHHIREGKHGARSAKQAIAIGLSKARRAGVEAPRNAQRRPEKPPKPGWRITMGSRNKRALTHA